MLTEQLSVPQSKVEKSRDKIYFKMQTNNVLRVRQFQPSHAALVKEMCSEILRIFLDSGLSVFHITTKVSCWFCVFCVKYFTLPHSHNSFLYDMNN